VQIHDGRCVAVDMVLLEAVSEKTLDSIRDLSIVVWSRRELWRGREVEVVAFDHVVDFHGSRQANLGKVQYKGLSHDDPATYSLTYLTSLTCCNTHQLTIAKSQCSTKAISKAASAQPYKNRSLSLASSDKVTLASTIYTYTLI